MKFVFNGTEDGPRVIELYGYRFIKGEPVEVDENKTFQYTKSKRLKVVDKLLTNPMFEVAEEKQPQRADNARQGSVKSGSKAAN